MKDSHIPSSLLPRRDVTDRSRSDGNGARTACALHTAQDDELVKVLGQGETNARHCEDHKGTNEGDAAAVDIGDRTFAKSADETLAYMARHVPPKGGRDCLKDHVRGHGEVDFLDRGMQ